MDMAERIKRNKLNAIDKIMRDEAKFKNLQEFTEYLETDFYTKNLFAEGNPWEIEVDNGEYGHPTVRFDINRYAGKFEYDPDIRMKMIEMILSSVHISFDNEWELTSQSENWLTFSTTIEYKDNFYDIKIQMFGENPACERKTKTVWKQIEESYIDCGMERDDDPAPFEGLDGQPVV